MLSLSKMFYMAPMLGITDSSYRLAYMKTFGGFDCAISPFIRTLQGQRFKASSLKDLEREAGSSFTVYPQILTNQIDDFIHLAQVLFDLGHPIINLNMGCPVPTAAGKGRGAGLLPEHEYVDNMLEKVLSAIPNKLSIKTRIGFEAEDDLLKMSEVFNRYPLHEVVIHPRTAKQKYKGSINHDAFSLVSEVLTHDIVYSGDIFSVKDFEAIQKRHPQIKKWMLGRGMLQDPLLLKKIQQKELPHRDSILTFFSELIELYKKRDLSKTIILARLKTLVVYLGVGLDFPRPVVKKLRKSKSVEELLAHLPLR